MRHIEKNVFENVFNNVMDVKGKTKDTTKARKDMVLLYKRLELQIHEESEKYPRACYTLDINQKEVLCKWLKELKFPDGYVSNME